MIINETVDKINEGYFDSDFSLLYGETDFAKKRYANA